MARFIVIVVLLTLAVVPAVSAEPQSRGELPFTGWFDAIWDVLDRVFTWVPTIRSEPRKAGAILIPTGATESPPADAGAILIPTGMPRLTERSETTVKL